MTWFFLSLIAAFFWAFGNVLVKMGFKNIPPLWNNVFYNSIVLFLWLPTGLWLSNFQLKIPSVAIVITIFLAAVFYATFFYAISHGQIALTGTVVAGYPVATIILAHFFLREQLTKTQIIGILFVLIGTIILSLPENSLSKKEKDYGWLKWGITGAFLIGTGDFLSKIAINDVGIYSYLVVLSLILSPLSVINYLIDKKNRRLPKFSAKKFLPTFLGISTTALGTLTFFFALNYGKASLVTPVSSIYPALVVILALAFLKEKINGKQTTGILSIITGIIVIGLRL